MQLLIHALVRGYEARISTVYTTLSYQVHTIGQSDYYSTHKNHKQNIPDSKVHGANMGPIWGQQDPGGPHVGPMNFAIWDTVDIIYLWKRVIGLEKHSFITEEVQ